MFCVYAFTRSLRNIKERTHVGTQRVMYTFSGDKPPLMHSQKEIWIILRNLDLCVCNHLNFFYNLSKVKTRIKTICGIVYISIRIVISIVKSHLRTTQMKWHFLYNLSELHCQSYWDFACRLEAY